MTIELTPTTEDEACALIRGAASSGRVMEIAGGRTRTGIGTSIGAGATIRSTALSGIVEYQPAEMVMTVKAGTPVSEIEAALAANGQMMAFEPVDHRGILATIGEPTIGGVFATNASGPRRYVAGAARDSLLGIRFVNGQGELIRAGGKVMKNVTGLDLVKLLVGSYGTLGFLTEVTFRIIPVPPAIETLVISGLDDAIAAHVMAMAMALPVAVSGAAHLPPNIKSRFIGGALPDGAATVLRLEGLDASVAVRMEDLASAAHAFGPTSRLGPQQSKQLWREIRDVHPYADGTQTPLWRVSVSPSSGHRLVAALRLETAVDAFYDWQGGLVWIAMEADPEADLLRRHIRALGGGHATLMRAAKHLGSLVPAFEPQPAAVALLSARIKQKLDPAGIFSPGKMTGH